MYFIYSKTNLLTLLSNKNCSDESLKNSNIIIGENKVQFQLQHYPKIAVTAEVISAFLNSYTT